MVTKSLGMNKTSSLLDILGRKILGLMSVKVTKITVIEIQDLNS